MKTKKVKMSLLSKIGIGFIVGIIAGLIFGPSVKIVQPIGDLFIRLLKMLVVPLVFFSLVAGVASMTNLKKMGRIGVKTIAFYLVTTLIAIVIGLVIANVIEPGKGVNLSMPSEFKTIKSISVSDTFLNIIPTNPIGSMASGDILQVIAFAIFFGISLVFLGDAAKPITKAINILAETMYKLTGIVISFAPYGVAALIAVVIGTQGTGILLPLLKLIIAVYLGCIIHIIVVQGGGVIWLLGRLNPVHFFKGFFEAMVFSFVTASSSATLPVSMRCAQEKVGVSKSISSFVQPLGATVNMDGTALYQGICAVFVAQLLGYDLSIGQQLTVVLTALLASIGTAGVPGSGLIMLTMVLTSVGLPVEAIGIVAGVDRLLDAIRCVPNVTGDAAIATTIAKWEGELDMSIYSGANDGLENNGLQAVPVRSDN